MNEQDTKREEHQHHRPEVNYTRNIPPPKLQILKSMKRIPWNLHTPTYLLIQIPHQYQHILTLDAHLQSISIYRLSV